MRLLLALACGAYAARWAYNTRQRAPLAELLALSSLTTVTAHGGSDDALGQLYEIWHGR